MKLSGSPILFIAITFLSIIAFVCLFGDFLTPYTYSQQNLLARLRPPVFAGGAWDYPLGTDRLGRDMVARLVYGLRMSIAVAIAGTIIGAALGVLMGFVAAHFRGWVEETIMAAVDFQASLPFILIALTLLAFLGNSLTLFIFLMGLHGWDSYARLTRGVVLSAASQPYAQAIRSLGSKPVRLYLRHILPNIVGVLIVQLTLNFPQIILLETGMSFLGLGIQPPSTSLGQILGDGRDYLSNAWWIAVLPGTLIFLITLSASVLGDALRDRLDPTLKHQAS